ncbi:hypothetical protein EON63_03570 [archaeon]|nr:MAG: hypothetical protein EON63_03570 [archaeon]
MVGAYAMLIHTLFTRLPDIFEVMPGHTMPDQDKPIEAFMSSSLQVAPGIARDRRPRNGHRLNSSTVW